jgi:CDP-L-myo-inositol myo-inositolphosphotransferase
VTSVDEAVVLLPTACPETSPAAGALPQKLLGLTWLHRTILAAAQSGAREFFLVGDAGKGWEDVAARISRDPRTEKRALRLEFVPFSGLMKTAREGRIVRPFWLIRGNLVFDPEVVTSAARADRGESELLHLVGGAPAAGPDVSNGIGVRTDEGPGTSPAIVRLPAKGAIPYAGISLCPASVFSRLAEALATRGSLRPEVDVMNEIFGPAPFRAFDVGGRLCLEVSTPAAFKTAERRLLDSARKPTDGFFSRHFNRHISLFLTKQFLKTGITPSMLSVVTLLIGLASGWFISRGGYPLSVLGALLFDFASIFDGCDGENARLTYRMSRLGGFLDITGDAVIFVLFFLCLPVGLYRASHHAVWLYLGILALVSMGLFYAQLVRYMKRVKLSNNIVAIVKDIESSAGKSGVGSRIDAVAAKIAFIYRRDFFSTAACLIILAGGARILMGILAIFMPIEAIYMFLYSRKRLRSIPRPG